LVGCGCISVIICYSLGDGYIGLFVLSIVLLECWEIVDASIVSKLIILVYVRILVILVVLVAAIVKYLVIIFIVIVLV
jgi:hypothetical protein